MGFWAQVFLGIGGAVAAISVGLIVGWVFGERSALRTHKREIDAGREYLKTLEQVTRDVATSHRVQISLHARIEPVAPREALRHLRLVQGAGGGAEPDSRFGDAQTLMFPPQGDERPGA